MQMNTSPWILIALVACLGLGACVQADISESETRTGITSPHIVSQYQSPGSDNLSNYTDQEIWDFYQEGVISSVFPTGISNLLVNPVVYPDHIKTEVSFDYVGSKRMGQARATLLKDGYDVQVGTIRTKHEGGVYFGIAPVGEFNMESFGVNISGNMSSCGLANKGYGFGAVNNTTTLNVPLITIQWGDQTLDHEWTNPAPSDWCMEPEAPSIPPDGSSSGPVEAHGDCFWCVTTYWLDASGEVYWTETECEPIDPSFCGEDPT